MPNTAASDAGGDRAGGNRDAVYRGLLATLAVACMLTAYEIVFFYRIVVPSVREQIIAALGSLRVEIHAMVAAEYRRRTDPAYVDALVGEARDEAEDAAGSLLEELVEGGSDAGAGADLRPSAARSAVADALVHLRRTRRRSRAAAPPIDVSLFADSLRDDIRERVDAEARRAVDKIRAVVLAVMDRETVLRAKVNRFAMMSACAIVGALAVAIIFSYNKLNRDEGGARPAVLPLAVTPVATVVAIVFFQYAFYRLGVAFEYPGKQGPNDEIVVVADAMRVPGADDDLVSRRPE